MKKQFFPESERWNLENKLILSFVMVLLTISYVNAQPNYGMRDDGGVNLPTVTYWYTGQSADITEKGAQYEGKTFGEVGSFLFKGAAIKVWKSTAGDVTGAQFKYKVWNQADAEPAEYTVRNLGWTSNDGVFGDVIVQTWAGFGTPIEVAQELSPGTYNLKIFFTITGTGNPGIIENGPFTATFQKVAQQTYPVTFTVTNNNPSVTAVKIKGSFNDWTLVTMENTSGNQWQKTFNIAAGSYEWGIADQNDEWLLPAGQNLSFSVAADGTVSGQTTYTIGGTASPQITFTNLQWPGSATVEPGTDVDVYAQVTVENGNLTAAGYEGLSVWVGISSDNTNPSGWTEWHAASYLGVSDFTGRPEYKYTIVTDGMEDGTYYFASRFKLGDGDFVYGGFSSTGGGFWNGTGNVSGVLTVNSTAVTYPVTFTVTNNNTAVTTVKIKGSFNAWTSVALENTSGNQWQKTFNIAAGSYEWGITDQNDEWLLPAGQNLSFTVAADGTVSGQTTYTIASPDGEAAILDRWMIFTSTQQISIGGVDFNGSSLGAFNVNAPLLWNGGGIKSYKSGAYDITGATMFYRVNPVNQSVGDFNAIALPWKENLEEPGQQIWEVADANINLTTGLSVGQYKIEIYFEANYKIGESSTIYSITDNFGGNYYVGYFSIENPSSVAINNSLFNIYPNPANDRIIIDSPCRYLKVQVVDLHGRTLIETKKSEIDLSDLTNGLYLLIIQSEECRGYHRFIIKR